MTTSSPIQFLLDFFREIFLEMLRLAPSLPFKKYKSKERQIILFYHQLISRWRTKNFQTPNSNNHTVLIIISKQR